MTPLSRATALFAVIATLAAVPGPSTAVAGAHSSATVVKPRAGLSFAAGSKQAVGYFVPERGGCALTLLIGEAGESVSEWPKGVVPARFTTLIAAGRTSRMDTAEGPSVEFFCSTGASFLTTRVIDRVAYSGPGAR